MSFFKISPHSIYFGIGFIAVVLFNSIYIGYWFSHGDGLQSNVSGYYRDRAVQELVRVCCLIITSPAYHLTRAHAINETWAPRCDSYFFISESSQQNLTNEDIQLTRSLPIAPIANLTPGYDHLTQKSTLAFLFAYENQHDTDWFVKADDDTYLIVENLKLFLSKQNSSEPITFGFNFKVGPDREHLVL